MSLGQFLFSKNQMIGRGHRMSHWSSWDSSRGSVCTLGQFGLFFSCQLVCPSNASILSHNHDFLNFCWSATISLTFETHVIQTLLQRFLRDSWMKLSMMLYDAGYRLKCFSQCGLPQYLALLSSCTFVGSRVFDQH